MSARVKKRHLAGVSGQAAAGFGGTCCGAVRDDGLGYADDTFLAGVALRRVVRVARAEGSGVA
jgi:hypothetical protein